MTCHEVGPDARNRIGPHLNDLFGRIAGAVEGFRYSESMERANGDGLVWDLDHPGRLSRESRITDLGHPDELPRVSPMPPNRGDVLAYLRQFSASPQDIPEAVPTALPSDPEVRLPEDILAIEGDRAWGEYLASECKTCHQADGSADGIPSITYWPEEDFVIAMHAYKRQIRPNPVMQMMAGRLSDEEIAALAAYFADDRVTIRLRTDDLGQTLKRAPRREENMKISRRLFLYSGTAAAAALSAPALLGQTRPRVVVIGGGAGGGDRGALHRQGQRRAPSTLLWSSRRRVYYTCFFSNLFIGAFQELDDLGFNYRTLATDYGINVVHDWVVGCRP